MSKKSSWKDKIDPAFDNCIKSFVKALDLMDLPTDSTIDGLLKRTKQSAIRSFKPFYEGKNKSKITIFDLSSISEVKRIGRAKRAIEKSVLTKDNRKLYKTLISLANDLPDMSMEYYYKAFEPISSDGSEKEFETRDKLKVLKKFQADIQSLFLHTYLNSLTGSDLKREKKTLERKMDAEQLLFFSFDLLNRLSLLINKKSLKVLYEEARGGNLNSLVELLKIDKTMFDHEWVRELMFEAMVTGDDDFFERIGEAIKSDPPFGKSKRAKMKYVLIFFWNMGLYRLSIPELMKLLEDSNIEVHDSPDSFNHLIIREIRPHFS